MKNLNLQHVGFALVAAIVAFGVYVVATDPVRAQRSAFREQLESLVPPEVDTDGAEDLDFAAMRSTFSAKPRLWEPVIPPPQAVEPPPDLAEILKGVVAKRAQMGSGADLRVQIVTPDNPRGEYYRVGDAILGCTVKAIQDEAVVMARQHLGKEYTIMLPRQR